MTISPHLCKWSHGHIWYLLLPSSNLFCVSFAFSKFLGCGSLPAGMTQTFILEECRPLVVLPRLAYNFPLTLITEPDNTKQSIF